MAGWFAGLPWEAQAYVHLLRFSRDRRDPFYTSELRSHAYACGLPRPATENAWGGVIKRASSRGVLAMTRNYAPGSKAKWRAVQTDLS